MIIIVLFLYLFVILFDFIPIYTQLSKKDIGIYIVLIITALTLSVAIEMGIEIPSPAKPLEGIISFLIGEDK
ncbi:MAG: hypothetical protein CVV02_00390 [Firmicutes bacterium HGW-Firmicutes-7]|nr:MAG: hypothetical protein CVV02_00390 [Firmicutes bacterium HGW-Firmicutes-7]